MNNNTKPVTTKKQSQLDRIEQLLLQIKAIVETTQAQTFKPGLFNPDFASSVSDNGARSRVAMGYFENK